MVHEKLYDKAVELLKSLIAIPSFSRQEEGTALAIEQFLAAHDVVVTRHLNNIWAVSKNFDQAKPSILLNSHHDTVRPNCQYSIDPFTPIIEEGKLYGLGSNDAGGCLVSLIAAFIYFYNHEELKQNLILAATAEEEISGVNGIEALLQDPFFSEVLQPSLSRSQVTAIVGEPTKMNLAIAERGLMVLDCTAYGKAGHAAREEGENSIYKAIKDIEWFRSFIFEKVSEWLGPVKMNVTVIDTENKAHNIVPAACQFVVDVRVNELYTHEEILSIIGQNVSSEVKPRSMRLRSTSIDLNHSLVMSGVSLGKTCYGSPTSSDKALIPFPALKCGPGDSARSHTADEYIYLEEIKDGIQTYIEMLGNIILP